MHQMHYFGIHVSWYMYMVLSIFISFYTIIMFESILWLKLIINYWQWKATVQDESNSITGITMAQCKTAVSPLLIGTGDTAVLHWVIDMDKITRLLLKPYAYWQRLCNTVMELRIYTGNHISDAASCPCVCVLISCDDCKILQIWTAG